jgi:2-polyprenyl-6-methoxyphenol hydroxylase-like FAD-dependent oxidoreductase
MNVVIIGGGIAGIAAAYCLSNDGHKVAVYEKLKKSNWGGLAYLLENEEIKMFKKIGLDDELYAIANPIDTQNKLNTQGKVIETAKNSRAVCIPRNELLKIFISHLNKNIIKYGKSFAAFKFDPHHNITHACFSDNTHYAGDVFIAADGINSPVRRLLIGSQPFSPVRMQEVINVIPLSKIKNHGFCLNEAVKFMSDEGGLAVGVAPTRNSIIWYIQFDVQKYQILNGQAKSIHEFSLDVTRLWDKRIKNLIEHTDFSSSYIVNNVYVKNISKLHYHNLAFCGESAHKFLTLVNVGVGEAIGDALIVKRLLHKCDDKLNNIPTNVFKDYDKGRIGALLKQYNKNKDSLNKFLQPLKVAYGK